MRILITRSDVRTAGPTILMHVYGQELRRRGHDVVYASGGGDYLPQLTRDGFVHELIEDLQVHRRNPLSAPQTILEMTRIIRRYGVEVINSFNAHAGLFAFAADPLVKCRHFNTVNGTGKEWVNALLPGSIIAVSEHVKRRLLAARVPSKKIELVYNATLPETLFSDPPAKGAFDGMDGPVRIVNVAMFTGHKGQEALIPVLATLINEMKLNVTATLVGDGVSRQACETMATDLGIADRIEFTGKLHDVVAALDRSDIFVHLPQFETFGIAIAEAMARALPVVSLKVGGIPEVVSHGETGFLLDPGDTVGVINAVASLIAAPNLRTQHGTAGRESARRFARERLGDDLERLYGNR